MKGFSLVELVVGILLLGLMASVVAPAAIQSATEDEPGGQLGREVLALLRTARRNALDRGTTTTLRLNPASGAYRLTVATGDSGVVEDGRIKIPPGSRVVASDGAVSATFRPDGTADAQPIVLESDGRRSVITVDRWTGIPGATR
jgi:prepilin-type N-terminal cleavage/methylation domain-containing protein